MAERLIFHVDVNSAFLSWEAVRRIAQGQEDIRLIPACIGGDPGKRTSVVLAKSIPAKQYAIQTGEPMAMALRKCPDLQVFPADFQLYQKNSKAFKDICREFAPVVEEFSIDECFLDMSTMGKLYPDPVQAACMLKDKIREELGFTVNVGIGSNKLLAKMAGDFEKPDKVHTLFLEELPEKFWPLPTNRLLGVGKATAMKCNQAGIHTIGQLAHQEHHSLQQLVGNKLAQYLIDAANGRDDAPVLPEPEEAKGYSISTTLDQDVVTMEEAAWILRSLTDHVTAHLRGEGARTGCVSVTIRSNDMKKHSRQRTLSEETDVTEEIYQAVIILFGELWDRQMPLRLLGVSLTHISRDGFEQTSLFVDQQKEKQRKVDQTMDALRSRFGMDAVVRGSMYGSSLQVGRKYRAKQETEQG